MTGNGKNRLHIIVKSEQDASEGEWLDLLVQLNLFLDKYKNGMFSNAGAYRETEKEEPEGE